MIPERSHIAKAAKSVFYAENNDIDIYIEDTGFGYEKIFFEILSRVFAGRYRLKKIFPLGSRQIVIDHCRKEDGKNKRPYLYVIDGDLHLFCNYPGVDEFGLFRLPFYCIENILIDPQAMHELLNEEEPVKLRQELELAFNFGQWIEVSAPLLFELFVEYALSFMLNPTQQTVAYDVKHLVSSNNGVPDKAKVAARVAIVKSATISAVGSGRYDQARDEVLENTRRSARNPLDYVSGKDYILPLLKTRFRSTVKSTVTDINLKIRLATRCDIQPVAGIISKIARNI